MERAKLQAKLKALERQASFQRMVVNKMTIGGLGRQRAEIRLHETLLDIKNVKRLLEQGDAK